MEPQPRAIEAQDSEEAPRKIQKTPAQITGPLRSGSHFNLSR